MEEELEINAKKLSPDGQYQIRLGIIRLWKKGKSDSEIAEAFNVSGRHVRSVKRKYLKGGLNAIKPQTRGRRQGAKRLLTPEQEKEIKQIIIDKTPDQLKFKECMWCRKNIATLIKERFGVEIKPSTLGYYLERWGFSVQRPVKRAYRQDQAKIEEWLNKEFPGISKRANQENAEIFFGDETNIQNTMNYLRGYAQKGKTPVVRTEAQKFKINMLSAVSKRGKLKFMLYKDNMNSDNLIDFMRRLITDSGKKVFLILDNLRVHLCYAVTQSLSSITAYRHNKEPKPLPIDTVALWLILERKKHIEDKNGNPDLKQLDMLMLLNRLDEWKKTVLLNGYRPKIYINYRTK